MAIDAFDFLEGLDPSVLSSISGSQLLQLIRNATPSNSRGLIIYDNDTPDVVANPRYAKYSWFKPSENNKIQRRWNPATNAWEQTDVGSLTVDTAQIKDGAVTLVKLYNPNDPTKGLWLLRVNAQGNGWELWPLTFDNNSIDIGKITKGPNNTFPHVKADGSSWEFVTADQIAQLVGNGVINIGQIYAGLPGTIPVQNSNGDRLGALVPGTEGQLLAISGGLPRWRTIPGQILTSLFTGALQALPAGTGTITFNHAFAAYPNTTKIYLQCISAELGYAVGDRVDINSFYFENGSDIEFPIPVVEDINNVTVVFTTPSAISILNKGGTAVSAIDRTKWNIGATIIK